jgi:O-methyltransferase domain/Dimerisation domain
MTSMTSREASSSLAERPLTPERIFELGFGYWGSKTLLSAVELGLFTQLAQGPLDGETLRQRLGLHPRGAQDFFDALVALGMLDRPDGRYQNTPETDLFLDRAKPSYAGGFLEMSSARLYGFWASLTEGLRTGLPQNEAKTGGNFFTALYADPVRLKQFAHAMTAISLGTAQVLAQKFPWSKHRTVVDIGTAEGCLLAQLGQAHPHLSGGGFDLPPLGPIFDEYLASFGLGERFRFYPGDFLTDPLPSADVLVVGRVLHDWSLEEKRMLLNKAYAALPEGGALVVYETILDDERRRNAFGLLMSVNMLIETPAGADYTGAECSTWMREVGFRETYVEHLLGPDSMVVGLK